MGSPFASQTTDTVPMPDGHTVTIHKISGKDFEAAQFDHMVGIATGRGRNWATNFVKLAAVGQATVADAERVLNDPLSGFDRLSLVKAGVSAWSYHQDDTEKARHRGRPRGPRRRDARTAGDGGAETHEAGAVPDRRGTGDRQKKRLKALHLSLDGKGPQPFAHYVGRLSEEFGGALPSEILAELARVPVGFLEEIIEDRNYAATKAAYDAEQNSKSKTPIRSETWQLVQAIEFEIAGEELNAREAAG
jgi:hypothetical protein